MKLTTFLFLISVISVFASKTYSQTKALNLKMSNSTVKEVLRNIEDQSEFYFMYSERLVDVTREVSINIKNAKLDEVLDKLFASTDVKYTVKDRFILLSTPEVSENDITIQQQKTISGKVTDSSGASLPGVSVVVKGTTTGVITDNDGKYSLHKVPENAILQFSFVGMKIQEIAVGDKTSINVALSDETIGIEEVVAVGYGTQKKQNITGSVSSIKTKELEDIPVMNIGQKLLGKFSGVSITQRHGEPGEGIAYRIRGQASINAGNAPLVVIDGFPTISGLSTIAPEEIESISILKDASAASLYGSRAANGVILVTTKSGKTGESNIIFSSYVGLEGVPDRGKPDLMNAQEFAQFKKEWYEDKARYEGYKGGVPEVYQHPEQVKQGTDWYDVLLRNALTQNYNLSISSGVNKFKSAINVNYNKQEGVILNTWLERFSVRANNSYKLSDKVTIGLNLAGNQRNSQITAGLAGSSFGREIIASAFLMDPQVKYRNDDGTYPVGFSQPGMFNNPNYYLVATQRKYPTKRINFLTNAFAEMEIFRGLKYKFSANIDLFNKTAEQFIPSTAQGGMGSLPPLPPSGTYETENYYTWLIENTLTYTKTLNEKHNFDALLGYSSQQAENQWSTINAQKFPDDEVSWFNAASDKIGTGDKSKWSMISLIGRLNYNYEGKYLVSMAVRRDGCSRFGYNSKWGTFPSVSLGWIITNESFMQGIDKISNLKLRGSYGELGNNNIGNYSYLASVVTSNYALSNKIVSGKALNGIGNNELTWETTVESNLGVDVGLFNGRISLAYDHYWKTTNGLLYAIDIPIQSGFSSIQSNVGEFKFWGNEFELVTKNLVGNFRWNTNFNISFERNKVMKLGKNNTPIGGYNAYGDFNRTAVGHSIGEFYTFVDDGVYMTQEEFDKQPKYSTSTVGSSRVKDTNGDGVITFADRDFVGNPNPDFRFGITNEFYYKNFDASIVMNGAVGGEIADGTKEWTLNIDGVFNVLKEVKDRWRSIENPGAGVVARTLSGTTNLMHFNSTRNISHNDYLAVRNITLGYTLPIKSNRYIESTRFYFSAQNIFMLTNYKGLNPEASHYGTTGLRDGVDMSSYPIPYILSLGINAKIR